MSFMHIIPLVFMVVVFGIVSAFLLIGTLVGELVGRNKITATFVVLFLNSLLWLIIACTSPLIIEKVEVLTSQTIDTPQGSVQIVWYNHPRKGSMMLNLNKRFECQLKPGTKIQYTRYKTGPYAGVSFCIPEESAKPCLYDKFEIMEP